MNSLEGYISGSTLRISVSNLPEFAELIRKAEEEADALHKTLHQLSCFDLNVKFETDPIISLAKQRS